MVADGRAVLVDAVVVDDHGGGADVGADADLDVADVGQVRHLRPVADDGVLGLDVRPELGLLAEPGAGPHEGERADRGARADLGLGRLACVRRWRPRRPRTSVSVGVGADDRARGDGGRRRAGRCCARSRSRRSSSTSASIHVVAGSTIVTPARIQPRLTRSRSRARAAASCARSLMPRISSASAATTAATGRPAATWRPSTSVRYSSPWALSVVRRPSASRQRGDVEGVDAAVDLAHRALRLVGVLLLDDRDDVAGAGVAQHAAVAGGVVEHRGEDGRARARARRGCRPGSARVSPVSSGRVAGDHEQRAAAPSTTPAAASPSSATRIAWPVPFCCSCTTTTASGAISARCAATCSRPWPTTTTRWSGCREDAAAITCPTSERPPTSCSTLGVAETMRVPTPAARTTTADGRRLTRASLLSSWRRARQEQATARHGPDGRPNPA